MDKSKGRLEISLICIIIGIMIVVQMKSIKDLGGLINTQRADELVVELNQLKDEKEALESEIIKLDNQVRLFETQAADNNKYVDKLLKDVKNAKTTAGLTDVSGPGIIITLDYDNIENDGFDPFLYNYELLLIMVNELNSAGAEAISINDERIINQSEIRLAGSHININGTKYSRPFIIKVIGNSQTLKSAIVMRAGIVEIMKANYINVSIKEVEKLIISKYDGLINYSYAEPVVE